MNRNYSGLTSVGSEIVSSNLPSQRNFLFSAKKKNLVVKSYKISDDSSIQDNKTNRNKNINEINQENKTNNSKINENNKNINNPNNISTTKIKENKKESSHLDLSNIKYKDGYILKDAVNSNPGFGLWSIKTPIEEIPKKNLIETKNIDNKEEFKTINITNANRNSSDLNYKYTKFFDEDKKQNIKNKKIIEKLNNKLNDLEKKYIQALSNYQEKRSLCENAIKMKKEYEELISNNNKEIELIKEKTKEMNKENKIVEDALINTKNEIERLQNVMKEDDMNMENLKKEFDIRMKKEEEEKNKLREIIKKKEEQISILQEQVNLIPTEINFFQAEDIIESEYKKDFQIQTLKEMILNLQIKISGIKKEINNNKEEMKKLNKILRYKNIRDEHQTLNISNLFYTVEENEINEQRKKQLLKNQNEIIKNLNDYLKRQYNIVTSKKIHKSFSQGILINKANV